MIRKLVKSVITPIATFSLLFLVVVSMASWGTTNSAKDAVHAEAPDIRQFYRDDTCEGTEAYYSARIGTLLILCGIPRSTKWGGIIWRVTENNGNFILGDEMYEVTVFAAERRYWNDVITRDGYVPFYIEPALDRIMRGAY